MAEEKQTLELELPHLGPDVTVELRYEEPTLGKIKEIARECAGLTQEERIAVNIKHMMLLEGAVQPDGWWEALKESSYVKVVKFWLACRPDGEVKGPLGQGS